MHHVVAAALVRSGEVLLTHRSPSRQWYPDVWDLPGGHVEDGESELQALGREVREELGVHVAEHDELRWVGSVDLHRLVLAYPGYVDLLRPLLTRYL